MTVREIAGKPGRMCNERGEERQRKRERGGKKRRRR